MLAKSVRLLKAQRWKKAGIPVRMILVYEVEFEMSEWPVCLAQLADLLRANDGVNRVVSIGDQDGLTVHRLRADPDPERSSMWVVEAICEPGERVESFASLIPPDAFNVQLFEVESGPATAAVGLVN